MWPLRLYANVTDDVHRRNSITSTNMLPSSVVIYNKNLDKFIRAAFNQNKVCSGRNLRIIPVERGSFTRTFVIL